MRLFPCILECVALRATLDVRAYRKQPCHYDAHNHTGSSEEKEVGIGVSAHQEHYGLACYESGKCRIALDTLHEYCDEEQTAQSAGEQSQSLVEEVQERLYVPCGHEQRKQQTYHTAYNGCPSCHNHEL